MYLLVQLFIGLASRFHRQLRPGSRLPPGRTYTSDRRDAGTHRASQPRQLSCVLSLQSLFRGEVPLLGTLISGMTVQACPERVQLWFGRLLSPNVCCGLNRFLTFPVERVIVKPGLLPQTNTPHHLCLHHLPQDTFPHLQHTLPRTPPHPACPLSPLCLLRMDHLHHQGVLDLLRVTHPTCHLTLTNLVSVLQMGLVNISVCMSAFERFVGILRSSSSNIT